MEKIQFDNSNFILHSPDSLNYLTNDMESILSKYIEKYKKIFDIDEFRKVQINYFDDIEKFRNYIYELRGEKESLPEYAAGTFDNGMINTYINTNIDPSSWLFNHKKYNVTHELFHIMYKELIWEKNNQRRVVWFDEGMAQFFSGEYENEMNNNFSEWLEIIKTKTNEIPNLNNLEHGNSFKTEKYDGYKLSLLAVKYLYDTLGENEFKKLLYVPDKVLELGNTILDDALDYYQSKRIK